MTGIKRLTPRQSRKVNTLVKKECCNCENGNCILLDDGDTCVCPQLISYSLLCKWFRIAVLPLDKLLYAELYQTEDRKKCTVCGALLLRGKGEKSLVLQASDNRFLIGQGLYTFSLKNGVLLRNISELHP